MYAPIDIAACERALIGNVLVDATAIERSTEYIQGVDFSEENLGRLFDALVAMQRSELDINDPAVLVTELTRAKIVPVIFRAYDIAEMIRNGVAGHEVYYATTIREASQKRRMIAAFDRALVKIKDPASTASEVAASTRAAMEAIACREKMATVSIGDAALSLVNELRKPKAVAIGRAAFGLEVIDSRVGLMGSGELWILAARPGIGKTALALQVALHNAEKGRRVLFVSLEMSARELAVRACCGPSGVDSRKLRAGSFTTTDVRSIEEVCGDLQDLGLDIWAPPSAKVEGIAAAAHLSLARGPISLLIVDYLSRIKPTDSKREHWEQVTEISGALKNLAREVDAPVLCLSQLTREAERDRPSLRMLRYSGAVEQDADVVIALHREQEASTDTEAIVLKNRHGVTGTIGLRFLPLQTKFEPIAKVAAFDDWNNK